MTLTTLELRIIAAADAIRDEGVTPTPAVIARRMGYYGSRRRDMAEICNRLVAMKRIDLGERLPITRPDAYADPDEPDPGPGEQWRIAARRVGRRIIKRLANERRSRGWEPRRVRINLEHRELFA